MKKSMHNDEGGTEQRTRGGDDKKTQKDRGTEKHTMARTSIFGTLRNTNRGSYRAGAHRKNGGGIKAAY